jgi:hypothetical protein
LVDLRGREFVEEGKRFVDEVLVAEKAVLEVVVENLEGEQVEAELLFGRHRKHFDEGRRVAHDVEKVGVVFGVDCDDEFLLFEQSEKILVFLEDLFGRARNEFFETKNF